jgi:hypothetical protein
MQNARLFTPHHTGICLFDHMLAVQCNTSCEFPLVVMAQRSSLIQSLIDLYFSHIFSLVELKKQKRNVMLILLRWYIR